MEWNVGNIVAEYHFPNGTVRIGDAGFANKTPEQLARVRAHARAVAMGILQRAMARGEVEGITREEWHRRYGADQGTCEEAGGEGLQPVSDDIGGCERGDG